MPSAPRLLVAFVHIAAVGCVPLAGGLTHVTAAAAAAASAHDASVKGTAPAPTTALATTPTAVATAVATAAPTADPMGDLRQRLAERLAGKASKAPPKMTESPVEVVLTPLKPSPPVEAPVARADKGSSSGAAASVAHTGGGGAGARTHIVAHGAAHGGAAGSAAHWAYSGTTGPQAWGGLRPDFSLCTKGQRQSPIDIRAGLEVELEPVRFEYQASPFAVIDNGHTVQANVAGGNRIEIGGRKFELLQFHFHRPSEERIDGRQFEMSLHLVHKDEKGRLAVVALLMDKGPQQPAVQQVWNNLPLEKKEELRARAPLDLASLLPADRRYYTYMGSLTTPPCSEGVQWIVMRQPVTVSADQIELFARIYPMNARPLQQMAGRRILQSP